MNWMSYEYDSFFMNIDCESRIWFEIDGYDSCSMNVDRDARAWFMIEENDSYSMNIDHLRIE